jgi:hypothetical protein
MSNCAAHRRQELQQILMADIASVILRRCLIYPACPVLSGFAQAKMPWEAAAGRRIVANLGRCWANY